MSLYNIRIAILGLEAQGYGYTEEFASFDEAVQAAHQEAIDEYNRCDGTNPGVKSWMDFAEEYCDAEHIEFNELAEADYAAIDAAVALYREGFLFYTADIV